MDEDKKTIRTAEKKLYQSNAVPPASIGEVFKHLESGKTIYIPTHTRCTVITKKTLESFRKVGGWLLREDGKGYRMQTGRTSVYLLPGQLKFGD